MAVSTGVSKGAHDSGSRERIVEASGLTKTFSDFWLRATARAVDGIDFHIDRHEIFGLLGPNGSGKSTTIKMILGLLRRTHGRLVVFGRDPSDVAVKKKIGYLPEETYLYRFLNPTETLDYYGKLFGLDRRTRRRRTEELLEMVGLTQVAHRASGEFSKGMARRLGLAQALVNDPELLILDEPTSGLDPIGTRQVKDLILELGRRGKTILLTSHLLADVEDVCDRMVILYGGRIRAAGTAQELLADSQHTVLRAPRLDEATIRAVDETLHRVQGVGLERVEAPRQTLEQLFLDIVEKARAEQVATSGAQSGGRIASFLQGQDSIDGGTRPAADASESRRMLEELAKPAEAPRAATPVEPRGATVSATAGAKQGADTGVLDALVSGEAAVPAPTVRKVEAPSVRKAAELDQSVIDALLKNDGAPKSTPRADDAARDPKRGGGEGSA